MNKFLLISLIVCLAFTINVHGFGYRDSDLMDAANNDSYEIARLLIHYGADVNATDTNGKTPIMFASASDSNRIIRLLVDYGANVNATDNGGWSALIYAAYDGRDKAVRALLRKGADAEYALKYATEHMHSISDNRRSYSGEGGYQKAIDTINKNNTFWRNLQSYIE